MSILGGFAIPSDIPTSTDIPDWALRARARWRHRGDTRPEQAFAPGPGQESVWDYPRPPRIERDAREVVVRSVGELARTRGALRVLETANPPAFYLPPASVQWDRLALRFAGPKLHGCMNRSL